MSRLCAVLTLISVLVFGLGERTVAEASGSSFDVHPDVAYALSVQPGGVATSYWSAVWVDAGMRLDVPSARAVGTCATGSVCAFSAGALAGTKLSWTTCGSHSTAALAQVGSIANARASGTLQARQATTVRASAGPNAWASVPFTYWTYITSISC